MFRMFARATTKLAIGTAAGLLCLSLTLSAVLNSGAINFALAQGFSFAEGSFFIGKQNVSGKPPVGTNCTIIAGSTDMAGSCTETTAAPVVTFSSAYGILPFCVVTEASESISTWSYAITTTALTMANAHGSGTLNWICFGRK